MIILTGKNLGERHKDLNAKVEEAREKRVDFDEIKQTPEQSDVDKLFKIALASKYMDIDYIIEVLKCGDPLYISKALKCDWMYDDKYAHIINPDNLQNNIIPFMSTKMKKKMLTAVSIYVRNESRAAEFYNYCMKIRCTSIALKFLNFTSDNFKLEILKDPLKRDHLRPIFTSTESVVIKHFIGPSFTLAHAFLELCNCNDKSQVLRKLIYLYALSENNYLKLLEKHTDLRDWRTEGKPIDRFLSLRISKSIMKKHKDRFSKKPTLYINVLNKRAIIKYSTEEDAKRYAIALLPDDVLFFWINEPFCVKQRFLLDIITTTSKYKFVKEIFTSKYPDEEFETDLSFYSQVCDLMTTEEKETWALAEIARQNEEYGEVSLYELYRLVNFEKAFEDIKKLLLVTPRKCRRAEVIFLLIECAKRHCDIERVIKYFCETHINDQNCNKEKFIYTVLQHFNVYELVSNCWNYFNKLFHSINVYSSISNDAINKYQYITIAIICHIIKDIEVPAALRKHIDDGLHFISLEENTNKLTAEQGEKVFQYFFNLYMTEIRKFENVPYNGEVKECLRRHIHDFLRILQQYHRTKEDCPELVNHFIKLDWSEFKRLRFICDEFKTEFLEPFHIKRDLKTDSILLIKHLPILRTNVNVPYVYKITSILKKLKIYFSHDIAKEYFRYFYSLLDEDKLWRKEAQAGVHALFILGDENFKLDLMKKFAPEEATINHKEIDEKLLRIQKAICSHILYSRRPVPLEYILMYLKGDYVHFCLPMFNALLSNLPFLQLINFVESLLNKPVSIQKHGIRLAFECLNTENLNAVILRAWNRTTNIFLRTVIFEALFNKIVELPDGHEMLFQTLKSMILTLKHDDEDEIFHIIKSNKLPEHLTVECIEIAWKVVSHFPLNLTNIDRMCDLVNNMTANIDKIDQGIILEIIHTFIASGFKLNKEETEEKLSSEAITFIESKWLFTLSYIMDDGDLEKKIEVTKLILMKCFKPEEGGNIENKHVSVETGMKFISQFEKASYDQTPSRYVNINSIMQSVIETLQAVFTMEEIYLLIWELKLGIVARKAINKPVSANAVHVFGKELGNLVKEFVKKELFFNSFLPQITPLVKEKITTVYYAINDYYFERIYLKICRQLTSLDMTETYWLVVYLLPISYYGETLSQVYRQDCLYIINKLNKLNNKEIRFYALTHISYF